MAQLMIDQTTGLVMQRRTFGDRLARAARRGLLAVLVVWPLKAVGLLCYLTVSAAARWTGRALKEITRGRHRAALVPAWAALLACAPGPAYPVTWIGHVGVEAGWIAAALILRQLARRGRPVRGLSARECRLWSDWAAVVAAIHVLSALAPWWLTGTAIAAVTGGYAIPWWRWRRIRPTDVPPLEQVWTDYVVPHHQIAAGEWRDVESLGDRDTGILRLSTGKPDEVAALDAAIECTIDRLAPFDLPAGSVNIVRDRGLPSARDLRVTLMRDPGKARAQINYFNGPTLREDGSFVAGYTIDGRPMMGRLYRPGGAVNNLVLGGPGSGKGAADRTIGLEAAMAERRLKDGTVDGLCFRIGIDGKAGAGMPELAPTFDFYGRTPDEWEILLNMAWALFETRADRYGKAGRSRWHPSVDPLLRLKIDEIVNVAERFPRHASKAEKYIAQGRSFGCGMDGNTQRGGGDDMWSTRFRANYRGNGTIAIGQQGDATVGMLAVQDTMVDLTRLPEIPGYMFQISKVEPGIPLVPFRYHYSVSQAEHEEDGIPLGPGETTVEDWATSRWIRWATLHPQDAEAIAPWAERLGKPVQPDGGSATDAGVEILTGTANPGAPWWQTIQTEDDLQAALDSANDTLQKVYAALPEVGAITAQQVADAAGIKERQARNVLNTLAQPNASDRGPLAEKVGTNAWRRAS